MLLILLIVTPIIGIFLILLLDTPTKDPDSNNTFLKTIALLVSLVDLIISLIVWMLFNNSSKYFQFIQEHYNIGYYDFYLGIDGLSIYFVLLTTLIIPISIISNWKSINHKVIYFLSIMLLLESLLLLIYMVLDLLMFYIFFESILAPLFLLIGIFGSIEKQRASFYFFLYTFLGSLFMLLSIITISYLSGCTDINIISRNGFLYITQLLIFLGIFIAFAVKTPVIYLNGWLLKAHVESPLSGSIILAAVVLKLSLYGIFRLILIISPKAYIVCTYVIFTIGVITIIYASLSTLRTIDIKELIAYSSVSHAAVYFIGVFSNVIQGIIGGICLGLAHGFVSSGLFTIAGGVLYDRSGTRLISSYRGLVQAMPILSILFFILCLGNCGAPLTLNFIGEFMSLYGVFERLPLAGIFASSSIVFSAAFTIFMFNRIIFGGSLYKRNWIEYLMDLNIREYSILLTLVIFTVLLGIYPSIVTDGLQYITYGLLYSFDSIIQENTIELYTLLPVAIKHKLKPVVSNEHKSKTVVSNKYELNNNLLEEKDNIVCLIALILIFCFILSVIIDTYYKSNYNTIFIVCWYSISYYILFILFFIRIQLEDNLTLYSICKSNYPKLLSLFPVIIILMNSLLPFFVSNEYNIYQILFLFIVVTTIMVFQLFNCFIIDSKTSLIDKILYIYIKYKTTKLKELVLEFIKNRLPILIITMVPAFLIRIYCFPLTDYTISRYIIAISVLLIIMFIYTFIVNKLVNRYSNEEAFSKALKSIESLYSPVNILIGLVLFFIFCYLKLYFLFLCSWVYINGLKIQIPFFKIHVNTTYLFKFFLENRRNILKLNFMQVKFITLFKSIADISVSTLTYHWTLNNTARVRIWSNVTPNTNAAIMNVEDDDVGLAHIESSPDIEPGLPRLTYHEVLQKLDYIDTLSRESVQASRGTDIFGVEHQRRQQLYEHNVFWSEYIVRHHMYRDTPAGLRAYSNLIYWACSRGLQVPAIEYEATLAKKAICQDPNLRISLEKLKGEDSIPQVIREILIAKAGSLLEELKKIYKNLPENERKYWSFKTSGRDINASHNGWAAGTLGIERKNDFISAVRGNNPLNLVLHNNPFYPHGLNVNAGMTEVIPPSPSGEKNSFTKYRYTHPRTGKELYWYEVADASLSWHADFSPWGQNNGQLAFNLSKILEDRLNSGHTELHTIMDERLVRWCSKAICHGYEKRRNMGMLPRIRGSLTHPASRITEQSIIILKYWMPDHR